MVQGQNILRGNAHYNSARRFSRYIVKGQSARGGVVQTGMRAEAVDAGVPRYRPHVSLAESQLTPAQMQQRANWQRQYAYGQSIKLHIRVAGWRQADGTLWKPNLIVPVYAPALYVDQDPLIAEVSFNLTPGEGHTTELLLGPVEGYTPDPGSVRAQKDKHAHGHKHKGKATGGNMWSGTGAGGM